MAEQNSPFVTRVPVEVKLSIFWYLSARQVARLRRVCKHFQDVIDTEEEHIIRSITVLETSRFDRYLVGFDFKDVPFLESLKRWSERRGIRLTATGGHFNSFLTWYTKCKWPERTTPRPARMTLYTMNLLIFYLKLYHSEHIEAIAPHWFEGTTLDELATEIRDDSHYPELAWYLSEKREDDNLDKIKADATIFGTPTIFGEHSSVVQRENRTWHYECPTAYMESKEKPLKFEHLTSLDMTDQSKSNEMDEQSLTSALGIAALPDIDGHISFSYCVNDPTRRIHGVIQRAVFWYEVDIGKIDGSHNQMLAESRRVVPLEIAYVLENLFIF